MKLELIPSSELTKDNDMYDIDRMEIDENGKANWILGEYENILTLTEAKEISIKLYIEYGVTVDVVLESGMMYIFRIGHSYYTDFN